MNVERRGRKAQLGGRGRNGGQYLYMLVWDMERVQREKSFRKIKNENERGVKFMVAITLQRWVKNTRAWN